MRLLGALGLVAPVALVSLWFGMPGAFDSWVREGTRSIVLAVAGGMLGVSLTAGIVFLYVRLRYGFDMEHASPEQAVVGSKIPILLIHGLDDRNIPPYHSDRIQANNPSDVTVWKVPGAAHTGAHEAEPQEFERRVLEWFENHSRAGTRC